MFKLGLTFGLFALIILTEYALERYGHRGQEEIAHLVAIALFSFLSWGWFRYIKDLGQWQEHVQVLHTKAEKASRAKTEFLANMSHEIRTPLNGIIGMLGLLEGLRLTERQREYVDTIRKSSEQLMLVINDVLDIAKIEAKQFSLEPIPFNIVVATNDVVATFTAAAQGKNLQLVLRQSPQLFPYVVGDPGRYRQILTNLISNAIKFTEAGYILINVDKNDVPPEPGFSHFLISVTDTGIGIPLDKQGDIFGRFMQADASTTRKYGGSGLGLAITQELVRMMDGTISVQSDVEEGSTFTFSLRLPTGAPLVANSKFYFPSDKILKGLKILVAEDFDLNLRILREVLEYVGAEVLEASNGESALAIASSHSDISLIVLDSLLPDADALILGPQLKEKTGGEIILYTHIGQRGDITRYGQSGFAAYIARPSTPTDMLEILSLVATRQRTPKGYPQGIITRHTVHELREFGTARPQSSPQFGIPAQEEQPQPIPTFGDILIAEDDKVNQQVLSAIITRLGGTPHIAENGRQAVEKYKNSNFSCILMDMQMPEMDGPEATRTIRTYEKKTRRRPVPIVALTANAMKEHRDICLEAGMDDYLTKPVTIDKLQQALQTYEQNVPANTPPPVSPPPAPNEPAPINLSFLGDLTSGDIEAQKKLLGLFFENGQLDLVMLKQEKVGSNVWKIAAHKLKGSAATLGAFQLSELCAKAEYATEADDHETMFTAIQGQYKAIEDYCEAQGLR
jgi:signal transduction histidine kinase/CheY-like chemotaxis protein/HPt (histidine-containing phosphotransfer) domain-containing protein